MEKALNLIQRDIVRLRRDNMLLFLAGYPFLGAIIMRFLVPFIPIENFDVYVAPLLVIFAPLAFGIVFGFNLIEEKEEQTWLLMRVVPLRVEFYFSYLIAVTTIPALVLGLLTTLIYGQPVANTVLFILIIIATALSTPLWTLVLGVLAHNKVEGLALTKTVGFILLLPFLAFVLSPTWQVTLAWNPWYWSYIGLIKAYAGNTIGELAINVPEYPTFVFWLAPIVMSLSAVVGLSRVWRERVE